MKRWRPAIIVICVAAGMVWYFTRTSNHSESPPAAPPAEQPVSTERSVPGENGLVPPGATESPGASPSTLANATRPAAILAKTPALPAVDPDPSGLPPETVLENMRTAMRKYDSMFDGNPVGTNLEITQALNGDNPKEAKFLSAEAGLRTNKKGELIDSWGTPYFFHQLSGHEMEIRSAGPDRIMWTADDLVTK